MWCQSKGKELHVKEVRRNAEGNVEMVLRFRLQARHVEIGELVKFEESRFLRFLHWITRTPPMEVLRADWDEGVIEIGRRK